MNINRYILLILLSLLSTMVHANVQTEKRMKMLKMLDQLEMLESLEFMETIEAANACTIDRIFHCTEEYIKKAQELAATPEQKNDIAVAYQNLRSEKDAIRAEERAEERVRKNRIALKKKKAALKKKRRELKKQERELARKQKRQTPNSDLPDWHPDKQQKPTAQSNAWVGAVLDGMDKSYKSTPSLDEQIRHSNTAIAQGYDYQDRKRANQKKQERLLREERELEREIALADQENNHQKELARRDKKKKIAMERTEQNSTNMITAFSLDTSNAGPDGSDKCFRHWTFSINSGNEVVNITDCAYATGGSGYYKVENLTPYKAQVCWEITFNNGKTNKGCKGEMDPYESSGGSSCYNCAPENSGVRTIKLTKFKRK